MTMRLPRPLLLAAFTSGLALACSSSSPRTQGVANRGSTPETGGASDGGSPGDGRVATWSAVGFETVGSQASVVKAIAVDRNDSNTVFAGLDASGVKPGLWRTKDAGKNWTKVDFGLPDDPATEHVVIHPKTGTVYADPYGWGVWHSDDRGDTWQQGGQPGPGKVHGGILCHPTTNTVWAVSGGDGVFRSNDGGVTWVNTPAFPVNTIPIGPLAFDGAKLYLGTSNGSNYRVYVSTDEGDHWTTPANAGLPPKTEITGLAASVSQPDVLYVKALGGVYKSVDGGASFASVGPVGRPAFNTMLLMDPTNASTLFVSMDTVGTSPGDAPGGIFKTTDGAARTWTYVGPDALLVNAADMATDGTLYAGTVRSGIWRLGK